MEQQKSSQKALKIALLLLLAAGAVIAVLPYGAANSWQRIFSFFGLNDFSAAADNSPMSVHVQSVGKADSILIEADGKYMLVDGGTMDRGEAVEEYLARRGIRKLDYVVNTHPDNDHIGGLSAVMKQIPTDCYMAPNLPKILIPNSEEYLAVQKVLREKNIKTTVPTVGDQFYLGKLLVEVLGPVKPGDNTNNNSLVLRLTYGTTRFLLMGDAEKEEETDILATHTDLTVDVLKVGHHGSSTSTTLDLLKAVKPRYAAVSVGDDSNHLPKNEVLKRLNEAGAQIYRTDIYGTVIFMSNGKTISIATEKVYNHQ